MIKSTKKQRVGDRQKWYDIEKVTWIHHKNAKRKEYFDLTWNLVISLTEQTYRERRRRGLAKVSRIKRE